MTQEQPPAEITLASADQPEQTQPTQAPTQTPQEQPLQAQPAQAPQSEPSQAQALGAPPQSGQSQPPPRWSWLRRLDRLVPAPYRQILLMFALTRVVLTGIGVITRMVLMPFMPYYYKWEYSKQGWLDVWSLWDSGWYLDIAQYGYSATTHSTLPKMVASGQYNYAFFPVYPLLMRWLGWLVGDFALAGMIISNVFALLACIFLYKLVRLDDDEPTASRAVKYLLLTPVAFILSGVFTESTFLALAIMSFYFAKRRIWWLVGLVGFFAALSRTVGVLLVVPLLYEYLKARRFDPRKIRPDILLLALVPAGLGVFMAYNHHLTGDWLAFAHIQRAWLRESINPFKTLAEGLVNWNEAYVLVPAWYVLACLAATVVFCWRLGLSYWMLTMLLILVPLASSLPHRSQMGAMPRYCLVAFPLVILMARLTNRPAVDRHLSTLLAMAQGALMAFWSFGFPMVF